MFSRFFSGTDGRFSDFSPKEMAIFPSPDVNLANIKRNIIDIGKYQDICKNANKGKLLFDVVKDKTFNKIRCKK